MTSGFLRGPALLVHLRVGIEGRSSGGPDAAVVGLLHIVFLQRVTHPIVWEHDAPKIAVTKVYHP